MEKVPLGRGAEVGRQVSTDEEKEERMFAITCEQMMMMMIVMTADDDGRHQQTLVHQFALSLLPGVGQQDSNQMVNFVH